MNTLTATLVAAARTLSLVACADMDWTRPGADKATVSRDLDDCRGAALRGASPPVAGVTQDTQMVDRGGALATTRPAATSNERFVAEHETVRRCMSAKGYQLSPAK
jgi:hypothetical protein